VPTEPGFMFYSYTDPRTLILLREDNNHRFMTYGSFTKIFHPEGGNPTRTSVLRYHSLSCVCHECLAIDSYAAP